MVYNNRNDGPPDLDELWRDFNRKLSGLFGGKGGGPGRVRRGGDRRRGRQLPARHEERRHRRGLIGVVVLLVWLGSGFFIVQEGQQAVVTTFGKYSHTVDAGFQWRCPTLPGARDGVRDAAALGRGGPQHGGAGHRAARFVDADAGREHRRHPLHGAVPPEATHGFLFENRAPTRPWCRPPNRPCARSSAAARWTRCCTSSATPSPPTWSSPSRPARPLKAGIVVVNVNVQNVQVPEQVQAAFNDAVKAGADRDRFKNEGQAYASDVIPKAQGTAARLKRRSRGLPARVVAQAEGDAQRFRSVLAEYQKAPAVTRDRLYIDTMQQVYSNVSKVMVTAAGLQPAVPAAGQADAAGRAAAAAPAAGASGTTRRGRPAAATERGPRSRDGARTVTAKAAEAGSTP
jgi:membrane protease subunit HflK